MKKTTRKLAVRAETIRALASIELSRAAGGDLAFGATNPALLGDETAKDCVVALAAPAPGR
jgi:hypothetical protein